MGMEGVWGFVARRCMLECIGGPPVAYPIDSLSRPSSSSASSLMTDLPRLRLVKEVLTGDVGEKRLVTGNSPLPRPGVPLGGDMFSMFWKVPLYRDDCRALIVAPVMALVPDDCRAGVLSTVLRREPIAPGDASCVSSTTSVASLVALRFPSRR